MLRILDFPEPLLPINRTLRFLVFLISAADEEDAAISTELDAGGSISKGNSDSVETVP